MLGKKVFLRNIESSREIEETIQESVNIEKKRTPFPPCCIVICGEPEGEKTPNVKGLYVFWPEEKFL